MNSNYIGIVLGGILPAILFGVGGFFVKASNQEGISISYFILFSGIGIIIISILAFIVLGGELINVRSGMYAFLVGATWALGMFLVTMALTKYNPPMSIIAPLNSTACFFTVLLVLVIFSEWKNLHVTRLVIGTVLIVAGAMLVSTSSGETKEQKSSSVSEQYQAECIVDSK